MVSTYILVQFKVNDFNNWKIAFDQGHDLRKDHGEMSHHIFRSIDDDKIVTIIFGWDSLENATSYFEHESLMQSLKESGVVGKPEITYLDEVEMIRKHVVRKDKFQ